MLVFISFLHKLSIVEIKRGSVMKKFVMLCFLFAFFNNHSVFANNINQANVKILQHERSKNEVFHDVTVRFISPYVHEAINSHYQSEDSLTRNLNTSPSLIRIVKVERFGNIDNYEFMITVEATGFAGENIPVVDVQITFRVKGPISGSGENSVYFEGFKQLKTYDLPQQWKHIIKKPLK